MSGSTAGCLSWGMGRARMALRAGVRFHGPRAPPGGPASSRQRRARSAASSPARRLTVRGVRHQRHRHGQPDYQRVRHDPLPLPGRHPPVRDRLARQLLDRPLAQVPLQLPEPHEIGQPAAGQHHPAPYHRRCGHHRMAERHHRARRHGGPGQDCSPPAGQLYRPDLQVSGLDRHHPRRQPGRLRRASMIDDRQIRKHEGSWRGLWMGAALLKRAGS